MIMQWCSVGLTNYLSSVKGVIELVVINWTFIVISCIAIALDVLSGFVKACKQHDVDSTKMKQGLYHKSAFLLIIAFGVLLQIACAYGLAEYAGIDASIPFVEFICGYIVFTEAVSILENCAEINPELDASKFMTIFKNKK